MLRDSFNREILYLRLSVTDRCDFRQSVLQGIESAIASDFQPIKLNMVVMHVINDREVERMVEYCLVHGLTLRFIEIMPMGEGGRAAGEHYQPLAEIEARLARRYRLQPAAVRGSGPARYFQVDDSGLLIGFITPQSQHFCESCNRVRLSASGALPGSGGSVGPAADVEIRRQ